MHFQDDEADQYGHKKLGGIGDYIATRIKHYSPGFNNGRKIDVLSQRLSYLVRCGAPDAVDSIVPMAYGNLALDLIMKGESGRLVCVNEGVYRDLPLDIVVGYKKLVDVSKYYETSRLRPKYSEFANQPFFVMTSDPPKGVTV